MSFHATINDLATKFAHDLLTALRGTSLNEIRGFGHVDQGEADQRRSLCRRRDNRSESDALPNSCEQLRIASSRPLRNI